MTQVYVAVCCDRHTDEHVEVFTDVDTAVEYARAWMRDAVAYPEQIVVSWPKSSGFVVCFSYELEADHAFVKRCELRYGQPAAGGGAA